MQSLCSLNSRMACSCSSLKSVGSDGTQGTAENIGSDGSFVISPPAKFDGTQVTLSVPVECHGKRRDSNGSHGLLATENGKCRSDMSNKSHEAKEKLSSSVECVLRANESESTNTSKRETNVTRANLASSSDDVTDDTQREFTSLNVNQNIPCKNCQETSGSKFTFTDTNDLENSPLRKDDDVDESTIVLPVKPVEPVKPVPVVGRAVSAYSIMEYSLGKKTLPSNGQSEVECKELSDAGNEENAPERRHSAFTPCQVITSTVKRRQGRLSTGCMKEPVTECDPLINGKEMQAFLNEEFVSDHEVENIVSDSHERSGHGRTRLRKSGVRSVCYSPPPKFTVGYDPLSKDSTTTVTKNHSEEKINEKAWIQTIHPCSSNGYLPSITTQFPERERTSRV